GAAAPQLPPGQGLASNVEKDSAIGKLLGQRAFGSEARELMRAGSKECVVSSGLGGVGREVVGLRLGSVQAVFEGGSEREEKRTIDDGSDVLDRVNEGRISDDGVSSQGVLEVPRQDLKADPPQFGDELCARLQGDPSVVETLAGIADAVAHDPGQGSVFTAKFDQRVEADGPVDAILVEAELDGDVGAPMFQRRARTRSQRRKLGMAARFEQAYARAFDGLGQ